MPQRDRRSAGAADLVDGSRSSAALWREQSQREGRCFVLCNARSHVLRLRSSTRGVLLSCSPEDSARTAVGRPAEKRRERGSQNPRKPRKFAASRPRNPRRSADFLRISGVWSSCSAGRLERRARADELIDRDLRSLAYLLDGGAPGAEYLRSGSRRVGASRNPSFFRYGRYSDFGP